MNWDEPRDCKYCGKSFTPDRPQAKDQVFCSPNHRKDFFKYGEARLKIIASVTLHFEKLLKAHEKRIAALEKKILDRDAEHVVTFKPEVTQ